MAAKNKQPVEASADKDGIPVPEDLHSIWRQVRNNRATIAALTDSVMARQAQFSEYEAQAWDKTMKAMGLDSNSQYHINYLEMRIHKVGSMPTGLQQFLAGSGEQP